MPEERLTLGQRAADTITAQLGSWRFILWQSGVLGAWVVINLTGFLFRWDPAPFILLNLCLSFQAAFTGPLVLMSSNRQTDIDRQHVKHIEALTEQAEALEEQLAEVLRHLDTLVSVDHEEHGRLLRDLHAHISCAGHTEIVSDAIAR